jgi:hypothetical protein
MQRLVILDNLQCIGLPLLAIRDRPNPLPLADRLDRRSLLTGLERVELVDRQAGDFHDRL